MFRELMFALSRAKRVPAEGWRIYNPKMGPIGFYKGKRCRNTGYHTSNGKYVILRDKFPKYIMPDLAGFELKPYVGNDEDPPPKSISPVPKPVQRTWEYLNSFKKPEYQRDFGQKRIGSSESDSS
eukprot:TRINITY_DN12666_c0_g1_i1.p1 TRINITY_DN12666_c0_g1~~TRINITY_DN12666_c0_g1_i1.p1  ORF type:complete len:125 (+),score=17.15 TRINITY_DN12666_c0_g1_i1:62-436(+)